MRKDVASSKEVRRMRAAILADIDAWIDEALDGCGSPIEAMLVLSLLRRGSGIPFVCAVPVSHLPGVERKIGATSFCVADNGSRWWVTPQLTVHIGDRVRHIDIAIDYKQKGDPPGSSVFVAVECDGHAFHERTPEQASRDKARDRDLQTIGWNVARFTGREIFRDPDAVAAEIEEFCMRVAFTRSGNGRASLD